MEGNQPWIFVGRENDDAYNDSYKDRIDQLMASIKLQTTVNRYADYSSANRTFMQLISKDPKEKQHIDVAETASFARNIVNKLKDCSSSQIDQWVQIQELKIRELWRAFPDKSRPLSISKQSNLEKYASSLRQSLHLFVTVTKMLNLQYKNEVIAEIIQGFYYYQYKEAVLKQMMQAGYKTNRFQTLEYEDKPFSFFSCCCFEDSR